MANSIFTIVAASGAQGSSVYRNVIADGKLVEALKEIRLCTRDPNTQKMKEMVKQAGDHSLKVKPTKFDLNDESSIKSALKGCDTVFGLTNPYDPSVHGHELELGKRMVDIAKKENVKVMLWSGLENCEKLTNGKYYVSHFTDKAKVADHARSIGLPIIDAQPSFYFSNFQYFFPPQKIDKGWKFRMPLHPDTRIAAFDVNDYGKVVAKLLEDPEKYIDQTIPVLSENLTVSQYVNKMAAHFKTNIIYEQCTFEDMIPQFGSMGEDLAEMLHYFDEHGYYRPDADLEFAKKLVRLKSFDEWLAQSNWKLE